MPLHPIDEADNAIRALRRAIDAFCLSKPLTDEDAAQIRAEGFEAWLARLDADERRDAGRVIDPHLCRPYTLDGKVEVQTLRDVLPRQALGPEYDWTEKKLDTEVIETWHNGWPGRHKNVRVWWTLADGTSVGLNENLSTGWSFPIIRTRALAQAILSRRTP